MGRAINFKKYFLVFFICLYFFLSGTFADVSVDITELTKQAEAGDIRAQFGLGLMYVNGNGVPQDGKKAVYYYELAAKQGVAEAQYNLGNMYREGNLIPQNNKKAVYYYELAAKQGYAYAFNNLAVQYASGRGVSQDDVKAYAYALIAYALDSSRSKFKEHLEPKLTSLQREKAQALAFKMWEECQSRKKKGREQKTKMAHSFRPC